jgi:hypothetical protein
MRQAITTKFLGPTNYRGSRVKASASAGSITVSWRHQYDAETNHHLAAQALAEKFGWRGRWWSGELPGGTGNCYVIDDGGDHAFTSDVYLPFGKVIRKALTKAGAA